MSLPAADYQRQLEWRIKQVAIGKASEAYKRFASSFPYDIRRKDHPRTPDPYDARNSKRQFEGRVKAWKRQIHEVTSHLRCRSRSPFKKDKPEQGHDMTRICNLFLTTGEAVKFYHLAHDKQVNMFISPY